jgi:hypothetical protein
MESQFAAAVQQDTADESTLRERIDARGGEEAVSTLSVQELGTLTDGLPFDARELKLQRMLQEVRQNILTRFGGFCVCVRTMPMD